MKKKKGFTLIELLAVLVIIAIIALISIPIILGVINASRKGAAKSSGLGYIEAVEKQVALTMINEETFETGTININENVVDQFGYPMEIVTVSFDEIQFLHAFVDMQKALEFVNSKSYELIQFSDILMGAISYHYNKRHLRPDASQNKCALAEYIANKISRPNLVFNTGRNGYKNLNLWLFKSNKELSIK